MFILLNSYSFFFLKQETEMDSKQVSFLIPNKLMISNNDGNKTRTA